MRNSRRYEKLGINTVGRFNQEKRKMDSTELYPSDIMGLRDFVLDVINGTLTATSPLQYSPETNNISVEGVSAVITIGNQVLTFTNGVLTNYEEISQP